MQGRLKRLAKALKLGGSSTWTRTRDLRINSPTLYQLSYRGKFGVFLSYFEKLRVSAIALNRKTRIIEHFALLKKTPPGVRVFTPYYTVTILCGLIRSCALEAIVTARLSVTTSPMMMMLGLSIS